MDTEDKHAQALDSWAASRTGQVKIILKKSLMWLYTYRLLPFRLVRRLYTWLKLKHE